MTPPGDFDKVSVARTKFSSSSCCCLLHACSAVSRLMTGCGIRLDLMRSTRWLQTSLGLPHSLTAMCMRHYMPCFKELLRCEVQDEQSRPVHFEWRTLYHMNERKSRAVYFRRPVRHMTSRKAENPHLRYVFHSSRSTSSSLAQYVSGSAPAAIK